MGFDPVTMTAIKIGVGVASMAGYMALSASTVTEGPRLGDLSVSASTYGLPIVHGWGVNRLGGNMLWTSGIIESSNTSKGGKGLGGKQKNYTYKASFAFAFGAGPAGRILRIWADSKLVYDETADAVNVEVPGVVLRQYHGTEDQMPDPAILADQAVIDAVGPDCVPGFRGIVYVVAEDVDLAPFGNRIPNVSAEIAWTGAARHLSVFRTFPIPWTDPYPGGYTVELFTGYCYDWMRNQYYEGVEWPAGIAVTDLGSMALVRLVPFADMFPADGIEFTYPSGGGDVIGLDCGAGTDLYFLVTSDDAVPRLCTIYRINPETMTVTGTCDAFRTGILGLDFGIMGAVATVYTATGQRMVFVGYVSGIKVFIYDGTNMVPVGTGVASDFGFAPSLSDVTTSILVPGTQTPEGAAVFWYSQSDGEVSDRIEIWKLLVFAGAMHCELAFTMNGADYFPAALAWGVQRLQWDYAHNALLIWVSGGANWVETLHSTATLVSVQADSGFVNWIAPGVGGGISDKGSSLLAGTAIGINGGIHGTDGVELIDTGNGQVLLDDLVGWPGASGPTYNSLQETLYGARWAIGFERVRINRGTGEAAQLSQIVSDVCVEAGMSADDIDVTDLTDSVYGYTHEQEVAKTLLSTLASMYYFDGVESEDILRFKKRGSAPVLTVPYEDFVVQSGSSGTKAALTVSRTQAEDLPRRIWLRYPDQDNEQQQGTQHWSRTTRGPDAAVVVNATGETTIDTRVVMTADQAKSLAKRQLLMLWTERETYPRIGLGPKYLLLDPADVVTLTQRDGSTSRVRLDKVNLGADLSLELSGVIEDQSLLTLSAHGDGGTGGPAPNLIPTFYSPVMAQPNLPLLRDIDDTTGTALRGYAAMGCYAGQSFGGAAIYASVDNATWSALATSVTGMAWGVANNALPAPSCLFTTDTANSLTVTMIQGGSRLETATTDQILDGANPALLINASGAAELLQYTTVTALGANSYRLTGLVRGRRGTEWVCGLHRSTDTFVLLDTAAWQTYTLPLGWLNLARYEKLLGANTNFDAAPVQTHVFDGAAERPYAPCRIGGSRDGDGNLTLTWLRRDRISAEWYDLVETIPMHEQSEAYQVDVVAGGAVVRTLTAAAPTVVYAAADQVADGVAGAVTVNIYQMSATVGRGYPALAVL